MKSTRLNGHDCPEETAMHPIPIEDVEDSSELDPRAPGVWALGSLQANAGEPAQAPAAQLLVHVRDRSRPRRLLRFARIALGRRSDAPARSRTDH
jgi:hypothetical protein